MKVENITITKVLDTQSGVSQAGKEWSKLTFVGETPEEYNNVYAFEIFGQEKVDNFNKFNKVGDLVNVEFNVSCNEWKGKYFTSLSSWRIDKVTADQPASQDDNGADDLPF